RYIRADLGVLGAGITVDTLLEFIGADLNGEIVGVALRAPAAAVAQIVGGDLDGGGAAVASVRVERHPVQGGVDGAGRAGEGHGGVGRAVAGGERQAGRAAQRQRA